MAFVTRVFAIQQIRQNYKQLVALILITSLIYFF